MALHPLNEYFTATGEWYLPEQPDRTITGTLTYTPGRIMLELQDSFAPLGGVIYGNEAVNFRRVCGHTRSGELFTLLAVTRVGMSINFFNRHLAQPDRLNVALAIIGAVTEDDPVLANVDCRVPGLAVWLSRPAITTNFADAGNGCTMAFEVMPLPAETIHIPALSANIVFDVNTTAKPGPFALQVTSVGSWRLEPDTPQPLSWYLNQIPAVNAFLSLCAGVTMTPDCITLPASPGQERPSLLARRPPEEHCGITDLRFFFLSRGAFADHFEQGLARWFEHYPAFETTNGLAMSILASRTLWPHVEFLSVMQALEGFHRVRHGGLYMDKHAYEAVASTLSGAIPKEVGADHLTSLKSRIRYGNEISLSKRLTLLCEGLAKPLRTMLYGDSPKLLRRWIDTRNYYTHWDDALRDRILDGQNLIYAIARLRALLRVLYLDLMGIPQQTILQGLTGTNNEAQFLIQIRGIERRAQNPDDTSGAIMVVQRGKRPLPETQANDSAASAKPEDGSTTS